MPYFDADGNEVTGLLTQDEAKVLSDEANKEAVEAAATAKATAEAAVATATAEATALKEQIEAAKAGGGEGGGEGGDDKDKNLVALRKKLEEQESAVTAATEAANVRINALEGDKVGQAISAVAGTDKDLAEKIKHNYEKTLSGVTAVTAEEIAAKVESAYKLSASGATPNPMDVVTPGGAPAGNGGAAPAAGGGKEFNQVETEVGGKLGISDADRTKYGSDPRLTNMNTK